MAFFGYANYLFSVSDWYHYLETEIQLIYLTHFKPFVCQYGEMHHQYEPLCPYFTDARDE